MRLFAAVTPPDDVLEHLETALASVRGGRVSGLRWTLPEARHITLAFYGEVPEGYLDDVVGALDDVVQVALGHLAVEGQGDVPGLRARPAQPGDRPAAHRGQGRLEVLQHIVGRGDR